MMTSTQRTTSAYPHSDLSPWQAIVVRFLSCITSKTQAAIFGVVIGFCTGCLIGKSYFSTVTETVRTVETVRTIETPRVPITSIDLRCDPQEESTRFTDVMNGGVCFDNTGWLSLFLESDPEPEKTIVSVGCNKGEGLADLYAMFDNSQTPFISDLWKEAAIEELKKRGDKQFPYGYCDQLNSPSVLDRGQFDPKFPKKSPSAFCVEPMRDNLNLLKSCHEKSGISDNFKIWQYAVGIPDGKKMVRFPDGVGGEGLFKFV